MDIRELENYNLADAVKFHDQLNPKLWEGQAMRSEVRAALLRITQDFREFMGITDIALEDIVVSGSNAAYSYTDHSDIDLHLVVDINKLDPSDVFKELFDAKKYQYNDQHNIKIRGYDVELYVQPADQQHVSLGEFSIKDNRWIRIPSRRRANLDDMATRNKYEKLKHAVELAIGSNDIKKVTHTIDTLKKYRRAGLDKHGEFGPENLSYKMLRTQGTVQKLFDRRGELQDTELSLESRRKKPKKKFKYGQFGGIWYPGYSYFGQGNSDTDADAGASEQVRENKLTEVKMNPKTLSAWLNSDEAQDIVAGFEAEMVFYDTESDEYDEYSGDLEPDYSYDRQPANIQDVVDFFSSGDYTYSSSESKYLYKKIERDYQEWLEEKIDADWEEKQHKYIEEVIRRQFPEEVLIKQILEDQGYSNVEIDEIVKASESDKSNPMYQTYIDAQELAEEKIYDILGSTLAGNSKYYTYYDMARDEHRADSTPSADFEQEDSEYAFLKTHGNMSAFADDYNIDWPYSLHTEQYRGARSWNEIADKLKNAVDMPVIVSSGYHTSGYSENRPQGTWVLEPDASIVADEQTEAGIEVISPPMPLSVTLEKLRALLDTVVGDNLAYTNGSTGLHMNISVPQQDSVDYVKLIMFMGDRHILEKFGRQSNIYAVSALGKIQKYVEDPDSDNDVVNTNISRMLDKMRSGLVQLASQHIRNQVGNSKFTSAHIKDTYIEFRSPGGDYISMFDEDGYSDLEYTMIRLARALHIASRPELERQEYSKKLYKLLSPGGKMVAPDSGGRFRYQANTQDQLSRMQELFAQYTGGMISASTLKEKWAAEVLRSGSKNKDQSSTVYQVVDTADNNKVVTTLQATDFRNAEQKLAQMYRDEPAKLDQYKINVDVAWPGEKKPTAPTSSARERLAQKIRTKQQTSKPANQPNPPGEFTGTWEIRNDQGEVVHTISGVGNVQDDVIRAARRVYPDLGTSDITVHPVMK